MSRRKFNDGDFVKTIHGHFGKVSGYGGRKYKVAIWALSGSTTRLVKKWVYYGYSSQVFASSLDEIEKHRQYLTDLYKTRYSRANNQGDIVEACGFLFINHVTGREITIQG